MYNYLKELRKGKLKLWYSMKTDQQIEYLAGCVERMFDKIYPTCPKSPDGHHSVPCGTFKLCQYCYEEVK